MLDIDRSPRCFRFQGFRCGDGEKRMALCGFPEYASRSPYEYRSNCNFHQIIFPGFSHMKNIYYAIRLFSISRNNSFNLTKIERNGF